MGRQHATLEPLRLLPPELPPAPEEPPDSLALLPHYYLVIDHDRVSYFFSEQDAAQGRAQSIVRDCLPN